MPEKKITRSIKEHKKKSTTKQRNFIDVKIIKDMFSKKVIDHIAQETGFIRRQRKLHAYNFFSMISEPLKGDLVSLNALAENCLTPISRAGISQRFNNCTCNFLQGAYSHIFHVISKTRNSSLSIDVLNKFNNIQIHDSSSWKVPAGLKESYPGYNQAGSKIQLMLNYKTGQMHHVDIGHEASPDQQYAAKSLSGLLKKNDLSLFDLAFATPEALNKIDKKKAFFICRFNDSGINVYMNDNNSSTVIDVLGWLNTFTSSKAVYDLPCFVGNRMQRTKVRLLAVRAPEEVANRRRQKLITQARKKGHVPKERNLKLCDWTLMITNIPIEKNITFQEIFTLYSIRWTIEIFFKQLKSVLNIHKTYVKSNPHRLKAEILARSIAALLVTYCFSLARSDEWRRAKREISFEKTVKLFKRHAGILIDKFLCSLRCAAKYLQEITIKIAASCIKFRQCTRKNSLDKLIEQTFYGEFNHIKFTRAKLVALTA